MKLLRRKASSEREYKPWQGLLWSSAQAAAKLGILLALVKVIASSTGPEGIARFGQFQSLVAIVALLVILPWHSAIIRIAVPIAEGNAERRTQVRAMVLSLVLGWGLFVAGALWLFAPPISRYTFGDESGLPYVRLLGASALIASLGGIAIPLALADLSLRRVVSVQFAMHLLGGFSAFGGYLVAGLQGAIWGVLLGQVLGGLIAVLLLRQHLEISPALFRSSPWSDPARLKVFLVLAAIAVVSSVSDSAVEYVLRQQISRQWSWTEAGYWQALKRLSEAYLFVIGAVFSNYYQPLLQAARTGDDIAQALRRAATLVLPLTIAAALLIYSSRGWLIPSVLSPQFQPVELHLAMQLFADFLRVASILLGTILLVKGSPLSYAATCLVFSLAYMCLGTWFVERSGWPGAIHAFAAAHVIYLAVMVPLVLKVLCGTAGSPQSTAEP